MPATIEQHQETAPAPPPADWAAELHRQGLRATASRQLLLAALAELGHATIEQLHARISRALPAQSLSTVYRGLETLDSHGLIRHTHLGHGTTTYMLTSHGQHAHLVCRHCGTVQEVHPQSAQAIADTLSQQHGFTADLPHLSIFGSCVDCTNATDA